MIFGIKDHTGELHDVAPNGPSAVTLPAGGITGLVGQLKAVTTESGFAPGGVLHGYTTGVVEGSVKLLVEPPFTFSQVAGWFSPNHDSVLVVNGWELAVRLREMVAPPDVAPEGEPLLEVEIPLVSFDGVWRSPPKRGASIVNDGDVPIYPMIEWSGASASVRWPSGFDTVLPAVASLSTLDTSPWGGFTVRTQGHVNAAASGQVAGFSEPVRPGQSADLGLSRCDAIWRTGRWSPWQ